MESFFTRFKNVLVLVVVLLAQTIGLAIQIRRPAEVGAPDGKKVTLMRSWAVAAIAPFPKTGGQKMFAANLASPSRQTI